MTPQCPKCSTALKDDYGMVTCPGCGAIVFVDMDGLAHVASDNVEVPTAEHDEPIEIMPNVSQDIAANDFAPADLAPMDISPTSEPPAMPMFEEAPMGTPSNDFMPTPAAEPPPIEPLAADPADSGGMDMNAFLGYEPEPGSVPAAPPAAPQNDPNDPLGISAYANSELSAAKDGPLVVSLIISGIDAKDLRDEIRQALQDSRFGWDTAALMSGIKGGVLRIDRISPVKATVIVNRIKNLSVRIRWEQNAITEIDPVEKDI